MAETGVVKTDGFEMEYCRFGKGNKSFVMIPGLSVQSVMGLKNAVESGFKTMNEEYDIYLFDRRRHVPHTYSISDMASDTAAAMKELGLKDVYLFGASQGGMIAMIIAARYPELVKKLVLGSTSCYVDPKKCAVIDKWIELAEIKDRQKLYNEFAKDIYPNSVYEQLKNYFSDISNTVTDEELKKFVILAKAIRGFDAREEIQKIQCPVMVLGASDDLVLGTDAAEKIAEHFKDREDFVLYMYSGFGHAAFDTAPDYRKRLADFFEGKNSLSHIG